MNFFAPFPYSNPNNDVSNSYFSGRGGRRAKQRNVRRTQVPTRGMQNIVKWKAAWSKALIDNRQPPAEYEDLIALSRDASPDRRKLFQIRERDVSKLFNTAPDDASTKVPGKMVKESKWAQKLVKHITESTRRLNSRTQAVRASSNRAVATQTQVEISNATKLPPGVHTHRDGSTTTVFDDGYELWKAAPRNRH